MFYIDSKTRKVFKIKLGLLRKLVDIHHKILERVVSHISIAMIMSKSLRNPNYFHVFNYHNLEHSGILPPTEPVKPV